jgi:Domain of unknown function (DUF4160)
VPRIVTIANIAIFIYADDHNPPHFHAIDGDASVIIVIADLSVYAGAIGKRKLKTVLAWAVKNQTLLQTEWDRLNP